MKLGFIALGCLLIAAPAAAQEKQDGKAVQVELIKFKAGTIDRVDEIESKYFDPAARKIGFSPVVIRFQTG
ncbi:hypothetical protein, partial [Mycoplasmopsis synoviae]|uniref:hypothetical protein n=2 Tax=Bacteria TaxID=2 RepID=UPI00349EEB17